MELLPVTSLLYVRIADLPTTTGSFHWTPPVHLHHAPSRRLSSAPCVVYNVLLSCEAPSVGEAVVPLFTGLAKGGEDAPATCLSPQPLDSTAQYGTAQGP